MRNLAGHPEGTNDIVKAELEAAGITPMDVSMYGFAQKGEVKAMWWGHVHDCWTFERAWYYWRAEGPGIPPDDATRLWAKNLGVRVEGHCANPSPLDWCKGFGVGSYHVDTAEGLKALADMIKEIRARGERLLKAEKQGPLPNRCRFCGVIDPQYFEGACRDCHRPGK